MAALPNEETRISCNSKYRLDSCTVMIQQCVVMPSVAMSVEQRDVQTVPISGILQELFPFALRRMLVTIPSSVRRGTILKAGR